MPMWQAPSTNNERHPDDIGVGASARARPYLDVDGVVRWMAAADALPAGATQLYVVVRALDNVRIISDDPTNERAPMLFGASRILIR